MQKQKLLANIYLYCPNLYTVNEGLGSPKDDLIHPIQEALYKNHGVQCGFCSPGMVMSMQAHQGKNLL